MTWKEESLVTLMLFRGFAFAREFFYFYVATAFDVELGYTEMTLIRVILSWLVGLVCVLVVPGFIHVTRHESATTVAAANLAMKLIGSAFIVVGILRLNHKL